MAKIQTENLIGGDWVAGQAAPFSSINPSDGTEVWSGRAANDTQVANAFTAARAAFGPWWDRSLNERIEICQNYAEIVRNRSDSLATLISREMGKTLWEARGEAGTVVGKIAVSIDAIRSRRDTTSFEMGNMQAVTRFKPHGVLAVLGPFNFPAHLPNGHIVPALLAGNTIVFKPSEHTPAVGAWMAQVWQEAGLPAGVLNVVQGARPVGEAVASNPESDGLLFTGSGRAGVALHKLFSQWPQKILALEMGGNNPLVLHRTRDLDAAAYLTVMSAFVTSGQRCTCARRLIVVEDKSTDSFLERLVAMTGRLNIGYWNDPAEPFCGTVVSADAGKNVTKAWSQLLAAGAKPIVECKSLRNNPALLSPGILDVTNVASLDDEEVFGPLLSVTRVANLDAAITLANHSRYGLSAGLISDDAASYRQFIHQIRAGIVNWNRQTTGASGKLPFGGCGLSGNHRPAGYYSADYCSWPVASLESEGLSMPEKLETGINP